MHLDVLRVGKQRLAVSSAWEDTTSAFRRLGDSTNPFLLSDLRARGSLSSALPPLSRTVVHSGALGVGEALPVPLCVQGHPGSAEQQELGSAHVAPAMAWTSSPNSPGDEMREKMMVLGSVQLF